MSSATARAGYVTPILTGLLIVAAGLLPWTLLAQVNVRAAARSPLGGPGDGGLPRNPAGVAQRLGPAAAERGSAAPVLRLWPRSAPDADGLTAGVTIVLLGLLYVLWIAISRMSPMADLSVYPTTSYRWSMFIMGGVTAGVVEEVAFRGYMQTGIEGHDRENAIWITSLVFVASHVTQGIGAVLVMGPGMFIASML